MPAARTPGRVALVCGDETLTHAELDDRATRMAQRFARHGVGPGGVVVIALPNSVESFVATFAAWKVGASPMPLSWRLPDAERTALLDLARPALVVGLRPDEAAADVRVERGAADAERVGGGSGVQPQGRPHHID